MLLALSPPLSFFSDAPERGVASGGPGGLGSAYSKVSFSLCGGSDTPAALKVAPALAVSRSSNDSDAALMQAVAAGDRAALARLYDEYSDRLLALARRLLRNPREAEDLVHDVFIEVWRHAGEYSAERGSARSWLVVRLRSRAIDRLKSTGYSRVMCVDGEALERSIVSQQPPPSAPSFDFEGEKVRQAVEALPADQRAVLELSYFEGLSLAEAAERLGAPLGTIKSRLARALTRLRQDLRSLQEGAEL
ncbi:MAG: sigma-70 family RNA polymerase sigma factor [Polyangiaceae bacterium]|jgi:RNA polymerase sigma-70 factor (ECF subfamily)|nr:sigma-70 family RNA polymerase sigma factor [Polyangiaceae bacterium]